MGKNQKYETWRTIFGDRAPGTSEKSKNVPENQTISEAETGYETELFKYANKLVLANATNLDNLQIPGYFVKQVEEATGLDAIQLSSILGMSKSKYYRVLKEKELDLNEVDILSNFIKVWRKGITTFDGMSEDFEEFLNTSNTNLGGVKPINLLATETGRREIDKALDRIEYGLYG